ncbi:hypothetical protein FNB15_01310 [Ferrovibrio terrae]|uniref:Uncharacterized protein n=1 Tax=Ferrovibrio terrae TaxID=2594003 RepID=A0A516GWT9_9PROT|nr:hypothetical protein [Ferrovibrio terrae]QDO95996.1 hypothetical protein FNB15_01310 [Ferrovibrio terrae]
MSSLTTYDVHGINDLAPRARATDATASGEKAGKPLFGEDGFTFSDFLDIINPLQHIPIVNTVYRAMTGDKIDPGSRLAGGGLFGGPIGLVASLVSGMVEESTGKDPGEHALAALGIDLGPGNKDAPQTMLASASDAVPAELQAQAQAMPQPEMKLGVAMDPRAADRKPAPMKQAGQPIASNANGAIELPGDLFQALKQNAATQQADARSDAINNTRANPLPGQQQQAHSVGPMQVNSSGRPAQQIDGRTWFPAHPIGGGGVPTRSVGTSPVTQANATAKFGTVRGNNYLATPQSATASAAAMVQGEKQNEWSNRATDAYQKYYEMQNEKNRRAGVVP